MSTITPEFDFEDISGKRPRFRVTGRYPDGTTKVLGQVEELWIRHLRRTGWQATGVDGSHRAVHDARWQAAWALGWDGIGYPFPVSSRYRPANA